MGSRALGRLRARVLNQHSIKLSTKVKVYKAIVLTSLLNGCETWTLYRRHLKMLERFHMRSLRSILGARWQDRVTNLEILHKAESQSIEAIILKAQLRWTGHVIRMEDSRLPKQLFYGELSLGRRKRGRPRKRYKDSVKDNITHAGIPPNELEQCAQDRTVWHTLMHKALVSFEEQREEKGCSCSCASCT